MQRRIFGIENEYGVTCTFEGQRRLSPDEVARYLFRRVVSWGRSQQRLPAQRRPALPRRRLAPGVRHPRVRRRAPAGRARQGGGADPRGPASPTRSGAWPRRASPARSTCSRTTPTRPATPTAATRTTWSAGTVSSPRLSDVLIPFLVTRQIICGAGKVLQTPRGAVFCVSQRADHIWEGVVQRDHPLPPDHQHPRRAARRRRALPAAARDRRRLEHVRDHDDAQGRHDRPGAAHDRGRHRCMRDLTLENPIRAIREISHDITGRRTVTLANGRELSALEIQTRVLRQGPRLRRPQRPRRHRRTSRCWTCGSAP